MSIGDNNQRMIHPTIRPLELNNLNPEKHESDSDIHFKMEDEKYKLKEINLEEERKYLNEFLDYMKNDECTEKLSRGLHYLQQESCKYLNAQEAAKINAYVEREGVKTLEEIRKQRDDLKKKYSQLLKEIYTLQTQKIRNSRIHGTEDSPRIVARSSGQVGNNFIYGYGYQYGVGYTDKEKASTAPGFELTDTEHLKQVVKTFGPVKGQKSFEKVYKEIFDIKKQKKKGTT